ncbi:MAG: zinc-dependent alcohol dehydrogenase [Eubacteriales bacterium]
MKDNEVLVKTEFASICGTDKNIFTGDVAAEHFNIEMHGKKNPLYSNREVPKMPFWIGHEGGGTVVEVGSKVQDFKTGDRVMSFSWCGTYADYFVAPVSGLQKAPEGLDPKIACLGEPVGCAMFSVLNSGVNLGDTAVVIGTGFAGLIMVQGLKQKGAYKVIAVDKSPDKLRLAQQLGADVTLQVGKNDIVGEIIRVTNSLGADVVMEAAGTEESVNTATAVLKHNGILVLYSYITRPITLNIGRWHDDSFDIRTTCLVHHTENERQVWASWALRPVVLGQINIDPLITHIFPLENIREAFKEVIENPEAVKVMLKP